MRLHRLQQDDAEPGVVVTDVIRDGKPVIGYGFNSMVATDKAT